MNTYTVTHTPDTLGTSVAVTKWFTDKSEAKRYAKTVIRHGYAPSIERYTADNYAVSKSVIFPSVALFGFFRAVDI